MATPVFSLAEEVIRKSFKTCGISVNTGGWEDSDIHCLKTGSLAEKAADEIAQQTAVLVEGGDESDADPFADLEDDDGRRRAGSKRGVDTR